MEFAAVQDALASIRGVHVGVDIGQKVDYTAIVVAEVGERPGPLTYRDYRDGKVKSKPEATYRVHELRRLPLGTPFVAVAAEVVKVVGSVHEMERAMRREGRLTQYEHSLTVDVFMDATGLGAPIVEMVKNALAASSKTDRAYVHPITFTYGDRFVHGAYPIDGDSPGDSLGKAYLVSHLQALLEQDRLDLPKSDPAITDMVDELKAYEIRIDTDANEKYGAFLVGTHDDMVTALGLACVEEPGYYHVSIGPNLWP